MFKDVYSPIFELHSHANILCASISSGFIQASLISPVFMIRTRLQLATTKLTFRHCAAQIYREHGMKGFFRGLTATYLGLSETAIYFLLYENMKIYMEKKNYLDDRINAKNSALVAIAAIASRVVATSSAYPHGQYF